MEDVKVPDLTGKEIPRGSFSAKIPILALILLGVGLVVGYGFGRYQDRLIKFDSSNSAMRPTATGIPTTISYKKDMVSYAETEQGIVLQYNGKFYKEKLVPDNELYDYNNDGETTLDPSRYVWHDIIQKPTEFDGSDNELFDFNIIPSRDSFLFIVRWSALNTSQNKQTFFLYKYDTSNNPPLNEIKIDKPGVPKIHSISNDGQYVAFLMHNCWNCGGNFPSLTLLRMSDMTFKDIGLNAFFKWKEHGEYDFKQAIEIPCTEPQGCYAQGYKEPKDLPLLHGKF